MASTALLAPSFVLALACAAVMGFAIQRGATCMVAAIGQLVIDRRPARLIALGEAALWVAACLSLAALAGWSRVLPHGYPVGAWTIAGGCLLGLGAYVNRACVFGAIARLGSGEFAYTATPIGFFAGCLTIEPFLAAQGSISTPSYPGPSVIWLLAISLPAVVWRTIRIGGALRARMFASHIWSPHVATTVIGIAFAIMMLTVGAWAYTDALAQLAAGMWADGAARMILFLGLLGGAMAGGWTAGLISPQRPAWPIVARCFAGGVLMGWGSLLIPGGNDGLILVGLPFLLPFAGVALASMAITIGTMTALTSTRAMETVRRMQ